MTALDRIEHETPSEPKHGVRTTSMVLLACVAGAAGLYFGREFFVPIVFAVMLNALFRPIVKWLERRGLPTTIAAAIVVLTLLALCTGAGFLLAPRVQHWLNDAPQRFAA